MGSRGGREEAITTMQQEVMGQEVEVLVEMLKSG